MSFCFSITINGRKLTPYCCATTISPTSAFTGIPPANMNAIESAKETRPVVMVSSRGHLFSLSRYDHVPASRETPAGSTERPAESLEFHSLESQRLVGAGGLE